MLFLETFEAWSFRVFGKVAPSFLEHIVEFKEYLNRAKIKIYPETYVSLMLMTATLTIPVSVVSAIIILLYGFIPVVFLIPFPFYVMIGFLLVPISRTGEEHPTWREKCRLQLLTSV